MIQAALGDLHPGGIELTRMMAKQAGLGPQHHVLDMGCGKGTSAQLLATEFGCRVTAVDQDPRQIAMAPKHPNISYQVASVVPEGPFDAILSECALCLMDDDTMARFTSEMKPGGALLLSDVVVEEAAASFQSQLAFVACIQGAKGKQSTLDMVASHGFALQWHDCQVSWVEEIRDRIHKRVNVPAVVAVLGKEAEDLVADAEHALASGHLAYLGLVARK